MVGLLALAMFINYVDRGNLATAGPLIRDELSLSNTAFGLLLSAFFWTYNPAQFLAGWLAQRFDTALVLAAGVALWAGATMLTGFASGLSALLAFRLLLGLGESVAVPCSSKLIAETLPARHLGKANGLMNVGLSLGPAFGTLLGGLTMAHFGWRWTFVAFGLASLLWLPPWLLTRRRTGAAARQVDTSPSYLRILQNREAWGASLGHFCTSYCIFFIISWLPLYLVKSRGLSMGEMARIGGLIYLVQAASAVVFGWLSDRWIASGNSVNQVRKPMVVCGFLSNAACMLACAVGGAGVSVGGLFVAAAFSGLLGCNIFTIGQTLAGPRAVGKWIGFQNALGNMAGILAPLVTGLVVDRTGGFAGAFAVAGLVSLLGIVGLAFIVRRVEPVDWDAAA